MTRIRIAFAFLLAASVALAEEPPPVSPGISDNSFLLEESYNQDPGVVQHINSLTRFGASDWVYTFTQEWPVPARAHQLSYTVPLQGTDLGTGFGDLALNYRYQVFEHAHAAMAPRLSVLLPTGSARRGLGAGGIGLQTNVPLSLTFGTQLATHSNLGGTWTPRAKDAAGEKAATVAWNAGQSVVWLARPTFNVLVELAWTRGQAVTGPGRTAASDSLYVSPGIRWAYNFASGLQIVPGLAVPIGAGPSRGHNAVFLYLSFEHPFRKVPSQ